MPPLLTRAPIDEVVAGFILDTAVGLDAVESGRYLASRGDRFVRHEIHEPILAGPPEFFELPGPSRVWLISQDDAWLVQLQRDRFHANWRRRGDSTYPGFSRSGGAMDFVVDEFRSYQSFCESSRGTKPSAVAMELSKIDLLVQGKHWFDDDDLATLIPVLQGIRDQAGNTNAVAVRWHQKHDDLSTMVALGSAQLKAAPEVRAFRVEFRATMAVTGDIRDHLTRANAVLNDAFSRLIPNPERFT